MQSERAFGFTSPREGELDPQTGYPVAVQACTEQEEAEDIRGRPIAVTEEAVGCGDGACACRTGLDYEEPCDCDALTLEECLEGLVAVCPRGHTCRMDCDEYCDDIPELGDDDVASFDNRPFEQIHFDTELPNEFKATFNRCVDTTLAKCSAISDQRGGEYEDSWALKNVFTPFGDHVDRIRRGGAFDLSWKRLRALAALIDVKISRMLGPWKEDTAIDMINYLAAFTQLMNEYEEARG